MAKIRLTQVVSTIKRPQRQKDTLIALGINKMNQTVEKELSPQVEGMIKKVQHLLKVEML
ncbi:MAG TPA: 50S ribosomal protein L30 [Saprospirales bacterium]|nr:50S ribosomal protein L30 [Saprospirales bacterium]HAY70470.1 50S ribosomal protein L30 [Saprospirales bacterium]HRQ28457.1 50S ribosomal protein L30 [Saprospiraceae bacterium]